MIVRGCGPEPELRLAMMQLWFRLTADALKSATPRLRKCRACRALDREALFRQQIDGGDLS